MKLRKSSNVQGREGYIRYPELGLSFRWNGFHTVEVVRYTPGRRGKSKSDIAIDVFSIGSFAEQSGTTEQFKTAVEQYMFNLLTETIEEMTRQVTWSEGR